MHTALFQLPDPTADRAEPALRPGRPLLLQVSGRADRQVHAFVETVPRVAVTPANLIRHVFGEKSTGLGEKRLIVAVEFYEREIHCPVVLTLFLSSPRHFRDQRRAVQPAWPSDRDR